MTPAARRQVIEILTTEHRLSVRRACRVAGLARAAWYVPPLDPAVRDAAVIDVLQGLVAEHGRWGFLEVLRPACGWTATRGITSGCIACIARCA